MDLQENIALAAYTTFKIGGPARFFCRIRNEGELAEAVSFAKKKDLRVFVLGGGSNLLVGDAGIDGLVMKMELAGVEFQEGADGTTIVSAGAGEDWEKLVGITVSQGLYGMENLSAIPGTVGASPVQNIGAYGAEAATIIASVRALDTDTMRFVELSNADCLFSYRDSLFKHMKGRYVITRVDYRLAKTGKPNIAYKDLANYFEKNASIKPSLQSVRDAVIEIRRNKLPDWKVWGTAGSFYKNPIIPAAQFQELKAQYPELPGFPEPNGRVKVSLGWILDKLCDAKSLAIGPAGVYSRQALVIVTKPGAKAADVVALSQELTRRVKEKTGLTIEGEVEWAVV